MSKELDTKQLIQRIEGVPRDAGTIASQQGRARVISITQESIGEDSTDSVRLLEKMNLGTVRFVASTTQGNTALLRCFAQHGTEQTATTLLTSSPNIGMTSLIFQLMQ